MNVSARGIRSRLAALLAGASLLLGSATAGAQDSDDSSSLSRWSYYVLGGLLLPAGDEGNELERGAHVVAGLDYEVSNTLQLGLDFGFSQSEDPLRTRIFMTAGHVRLAPAPEFETFYMQGGPGLYLVGYDPRTPGLTAPAAKFRPGLNFGVGFEFLRRSRFVFGGQLVYHGIVIARSDALSYLGAGITVALKPSPL